MCHLLAFSSHQLVGVDITFTVAWWQLILSDTVTICLSNWFLEDYILFCSVLKLFFMVCSMQYLNFLVLCQSTELFPLINDVLQCCLEQFSTWLLRQCHLSLSDLSYLRVGLPQYASSSTSVQGMHIGVGSCFSS